MNEPGRGAWQLPWAVAAAAFAVYAWTAAPALGWLDAPELIAAGASLGVAHSPGHPLAGLLGRLATLIPVGDVAVRINLLSAAAGAVAAGALAAAARRAIVGAAPSISAAAQTALAAATALVFAFSWAAWFQGVRAEVYALQAALLCGALAALFAFADTRRPAPLLVAGLLCGLALAHHHLMAVLFLLPAAAYALSLRPSVSTASSVATCGLLGLAAWLYLPVRALRNPIVNWGDPQTADRFAWTVSAKAFQKTAAAEHVSSFGQDAAQIVAALVDHATPVLAAAALLGLYLGLRRPGCRRLVALLGGVIAFAAVGRAAFGFDPETPDHHAYLLPAVAAFTLLGALGLARLAEVIPGGTRRAVGATVAAVAVALVPWQLARNGSDASLRGAYAADALARAELEPLPPRSLVVTSYFQTAFRHWALRAAEHARPDVAILDRSFLTYPGFAGVARKTYPELSALIDAPLRAGAPTPVDELAALATRRPVAMQLHLNLDDDAERHLIPRGVFARFAPQPPTPAERDAARADDDASVTALANALATGRFGDRTGARDALLWLHVMRAEFYCARGQRAAGAGALAAAAQLAPGDESLGAIAQQCGLTNF